MYVTPAHIPLPKDSVAWSHIINCKEGWEIQSSCVPRKWRKWVCKKSIWRLLEKKSYCKIHSLSSLKIKIFMYLNVTYLFVNLIVSTKNEEIWILALEHHFLNYFCISSKCLIALMAFTALYKSVLFSQMDPALIVECFPFICSGEIFCFELFSLPWN